MSGPLHRSTAVALEFIAKALFHLGDPEVSGKGDGGRPAPIGSWAARAAVTSLASLPLEESPLWLAVGTLSARTRAPHQRQRMGGEKGDQGVCR